MPTYNGAMRIRSAIDSILAQNFQDFELLIIDDGSSDHTEDIVAKYTDTRIRYVKNEQNMGVQKTLNTGLCLALGKYIARLDDDDRWIDSQKLNIQYDFLEKHPEYALIGTGVVLVNEDNSELLRYQLPQSDEGIRRSILSKNCFVHSSVLFRKSTALECGGYSEEKEVRHIEDYDLWLRMGLVAKFANLPYYMTQLTVWPANVSSQNRNAQFISNIRLIQRFKKQYPFYLKGIIVGYIRMVFYGVFRSVPLLKIKNKIFKLYKEF